MHVEAESPNPNQPGVRRRAPALGLAATALLVAAVGLGFAAVQHPRIPMVPPSSPPLPVAPVPTSAFTGPTTGLGFSVAEDPAAHQVVLFGGIDSANTTLLWNGTRWSHANPHSSPPGRAGAAAAYDPATRTVMLFGGSLPAGQSLNDTWAWNGSTWRRLDSGLHGPPDGSGAQMAWDGADSEMVLVTDAETTNGAETWTWNGSTWTRQAHGNLSVTVFGDVLAYDPVSRTVLLVTPVSPDNGESLTLGWNGSSWKTLLNHGPEIEGMALDPQVGALVGCGIATYSASFQVVDSCWRIDVTQWSQLQAAVPAATSKQMVVEAEATDPDHARILMFAWLIRAIPGQPQPLHVWFWTGLVWTQVG